MLVETVNGTLEYLIPWTSQSSRMLAFWRPPTDRSKLLVDTSSIFKCQVL